jgi:hypothetical protein
LAETLVVINLGAKSKTLLNQITKSNPDLGRIITNVARKAVSGATDLAVASYKSASPIDTGEFRGQGLDSGYIRRTYKSSPIEGTVYITSDTHYGRDKKPIAATSLANLLNIGKSKKGGDLHRTKDSANITVSGVTFSRQPFRSETEGWEEKAFYEFTLNLPEYLSSTNFNG